MDLVIKPRTLSERRIPTAALNLANRVVEARRVYHFSLPSLPSYKRPGDQSKRSGTHANCAKKGNRF